MKAFGEGRLEEMFFLTTAYDFCSFAGFQSFQGTNETFFHGIGEKKSFCNVFLPVFGRGKVHDRPAKFSGTVFDIGDQLFGNVFEIIRELPERDTHGEQTSNSGLFSHKGAEIAVYDHAIKKRKLPLDFISVLVYHFAHRVKPPCLDLAYVHCSTLNRVLALFYFGCGRRFAL